MRFNNNNGMMPSQTGRTATPVENEIKKLSDELNDIKSRLTSVEETQAAMPTSIETANLAADDVHADNVYTENLSVENDASIQGDLSAAKVTAPEIEGQNVKSTKVTATQEVKAPKGDFDEADITELNVNTLSLNTFNVNELNATNVNTTNVDADNADIANADITQATVDSETVETLNITDKVTGKDAEFTGSTDMDVARVKTLYILTEAILKNASTDSLMANKINISPYNVQLVPENGWFHIHHINQGRFFLYLSDFTDIRTNLNEMGNVLFAASLEYRVNNKQAVAHLSYTQRQAIFEKIYIDNNGEVWLKRGSAIDDSRRIIIFSESEKELITDTFAENAETFDTSIAKYVDLKAGGEDVYIGNVYFKGNVKFDGQVTIGGLTADHAEYLGNSEKVTADDNGNLSVDGDAAITGNETVGGNLSVTGEVSSTGGFIGNLTGTAQKATGDKNGDDITTTYQKKLAAGENLEINEIAGVLTISCKIDTMNFKGSVTNETDLPSSGNNIGDIYNVTANGTWWCWNGTAWISVGAVIDIDAIIKQTLNVTYAIKTVADWEYMVAHFANPGPNDDFSKIALLCDIPATATGISFSPNLFIGYGNPVIYANCSVNNAKNVTFSGITTTIAPNNSENCKFINCTLSPTSGISQFDLANIKDCELDFDCSIVDKITFQNIKNCKVKIRGIGWFTQNFALENVNGCNFIFADNLAIRECLFYYAKNVFDCSFSCETHGLSFPIVKNSAFTVEFKDCKFDMIEDSLITKGVFTGCEINILITTIYDSNTYKANITGGEFNRCKVFAEINLASASTFQQAPITGGKFYVCKLETKATNYNDLYNGTIFFNSGVANNTPNTLFIANSKVITQTGIIAYVTNSEVEVTDNSVTPNNNGWIYCGVFDNCNIKYSYPNYNPSGIVVLLQQRLKIYNSTIEFYFGNKKVCPSTVSSVAQVGVMVEVNNTRVRVVGDFSDSNTKNFKLGSLVTNLAACMIEICNTGSSVGTDFSLTSFLSWSKTVGNATADITVNGGSNVGSITNNYQL